MIIDCGRCETRGNGCGDCVITVLGPPNVAGYLGEAEVRALGVLADAGLVPPLRLTLVDAGQPSPRTWAGTVFPAAKAS
jgi:hypothetical protein